MEQISENVVRQRSVIILPFPFSDLQRKKARPAIIVSNSRYNTYSKDVVAVPLTSSPRSSKYSIPVTNKEMECGELVVDSNARVDKIFSVEKSIIIKNIGRVDGKTHLVIRSLLSTLVK